MAIDERLQQMMEFSDTLDDLKSVYRKNLIMDGSREENSAEHSWHIAILAMFMDEYATQELDQLRTMKMLLIHDVIEIDAGDTFCYDEQGYEDKEERERAAADRIFGLLPDGPAGELRGLWDEFEECATPEAMFANSLDRFQVLRQNLKTKGGTWRLYNIPKSKVLVRMGQVREGAPALWPVVMELLGRAVAEGMLTDDTVESGDLNS